MKNQRLTNAQIIRFIFFKEAEVRYTGQGVVLQARFR